MTKTNWLSKGKEKIADLIEKEMEECPKEKNCYINDIFGVVDDLLKNQYRQDREAVIKEIDRIQKSCEEADGLIDGITALSELRTKLKTT